MPKGAPTPNARARIVFLSRKAGGGASECNPLKGYPGVHLLTGENVLIR